MLASELWLNLTSSLPTAHRGPILTFSCYGDRPLAQMGDMNVVITAGQEHSIAQTRAFSTLYLALLVFACFCGKRDDLYETLQRLPAAGRIVLDIAARPKPGVHCQP